jgi:hypothetical protein
MSVDIQRRYSFSGESTPPDRASRGPDAVCRFADVGLVDRINAVPANLFRAAPPSSFFRPGHATCPNIARYHSKRPFMGEGFTPEAVMASRVTEQVGSPHCLACSDEMRLTMIIPPFGSPHGLKVYTCPKCGRSESYLTTAPSKAA